MPSSTPALTRESATSDLIGALAAGAAPPPLPGLAELASWSVLEIKERWGLDDRDAAALFAAFELGRRRQAEQAGERPVFDTPAKVFAFAAPAARDLRYEVFRVFVLDSRNRLVADDVVSRGILTASLVHPREVFRPALIAAGAAVIVSHNHPSGDPTPSKDDDGVTERIAKSGDLLGIALLDHVVIGERSYWSYRERGGVSSRLDLAASRPGDRSLSTGPSAREGRPVSTNPDPYAFALAPTGGIEAGHLLEVEGGWFGILTRGSVVCRTYLPVAERSAALRALRAAGFDGEPVPLPRALEVLGSTVREYFAGAPVDPVAVPAVFDPGPMNALAHDVYRELRRVPRGEVVSYGALAERAGRPGAARSVGGFMARNRLPLLVPCHRVVGHDGSLRGFSSSGGLADKRRLLALEGVLAGIEGVKA